MPAMDARLTGHVEPYRRDGHAVRGWWRLVVELPGGGRKRRVKTVEVGGKKDAEQLLIDWIVELRRELFGEQDPTTAELCDMWAASRKAARAVAHLLFGVPTTSTNWLPAAAPSPVPNQTTSRIVPKLSAPASR